MVTRGTKAGKAPASIAYVGHVLDTCGILPRMLRSTRLVDLVNTMDPKLVAGRVRDEPRRSRDLSRRPCRRRPVVEFVKPAWQGNPTRSKFDHSRMGVRAAIGHDTP